MEFIIETDTADLLQRPISPVMVICYITQDTQKHPLLPELKSGGFWVMGKVSTQHSLSDPINGGLTVETSAIPIHSIDIHLLRVESILLGEKFVTETSLSQTCQIADGDVCRNLTLPICDTVPSFDMSNNLSWAATGFCLTIFILNFELAMETLPLELVRTK